MRIGFLGAGKMAEAILSALLRNRVALPAALVACDVVAARRAFLHRRYRVPVTASAAKTVAACDVLFLSVKPQDLDALLAAIGPRLRPRQVLFSIAAGKTLAHLQQLAGAKIRLVRVMPNLPVMVGEGMSVFCLGARARAADRRLAVRRARSTRSTSICVSTRRS
jgi:pyrroline-5-carboxylate reductase